MELSFICYWMMIRTRVKVYAHSLHLLGDLPVSTGCWVHTPTALAGLIKNWCTSALVKGDTASPPHSPSVGGMSEGKTPSPAPYMPTSIEAVWPPWEKDCHKRVLLTGEDGLCGGPW